MLFMAFPRVQKTPTFHQWCSIWSIYSAYSVYVFFLIVIIWYIYMYICCFFVLFLCFCVLFSSALLRFVPWFPCSTGFINRPGKVGGPWYLALWHDKLRWHMIRMMKIVTLLSHLRSQWLSMIVTKVSHGLACQQDGLTYSRETVQLSLVPVIVCSSFKFGVLHTFHFIFFKFVGLLRRSQ